MVTVQGPTPVPATWAGMYSFILIDLSYLKSDICIFKIGMVPRVPRQIVRIHVRMVAIAHRQTHVHVHRNGKTNSFCKNLSVKDKWR